MKQVVEELTATFPSLVLPGKLAVLDILGRVRPLHAAPWLVERLDDPETDVRARACHALGCIGDPNRAYELTRALDDPDWPGGVRVTFDKMLEPGAAHTAGIHLGDAQVHEVHQPRQSGVDVVHVPAVDVLFIR